MSQTKIKSAPPEGLPLPCCPHCGGELAAVGHFMWQAQNAVILCVYCPHQECRKVLETAIIVSGGPAAEPSRIASPH
jgi:hypothetical protein